MSTTFKYRVTCDEFPDVIEDDSTIFVSNFEQSKGGLARELAESYMQNVIYDWEDETEPSDLFEISVTQDGNRFDVSFFSNTTYSLDHKIVVELEECEPDIDKVAAAIEGKSFRKTEKTEPKIKFSILFEYNYRTIQIYRGIAPGPKHWYFEIDTIVFEGPVYGLRKDAIVAAKLEADRISAKQVAESRAAKLVRDAGQLTVR